jgi:metal-sulfur cluster biosynthetic enzyme
VRKTTLSLSAVAETRDPLLGKQRVINALCECRDVEVPVKLVDLGLVYDMEVESEKRMRVPMNSGLRMLTSSSCAVRSGSRPG